MSSTDRRIGLETSVSHGMPSSTRHGEDKGANARREATQDDRRAFEQAMSHEKHEASPHAEPHIEPHSEPRAEPHAERPEEVPPPPFALFGAFTAPVPLAAAGGSPAPGELSEDLRQAAERLLVGDGSSGRREVRIDLKDEVLPGVTVSVFEEQGCLVAAFVCASEPSREKLCACASALAGELAGALQRPVLVRVCTDDPEDPCPFEASADPAAP